VTYAEALVYAAAHVAAGPFAAYRRVLVLREEQPPEETTAQLKAAGTMLDEFRAFDPRGNPDGK
jgi:hypothetical protein